MPKALGAGSEVDAWCTKCRLDLLHRIVAMVQGRPKRVVCTTCGSEHNYRPPKAEPAAKAARAKASGAPKPAQASPSARSRSEAQRLKEWEDRVLGQTATAFTRFSIDKTFSPDQLVLHRKFGEGYVVEVLENGKVSIMFRDGAKTLVHGQPSAGT